MPRAIRQAKQNCPKKIRKNSMKLKLESDLKALYAGRNQQRNESGMKKTE